MIPFSSSAPVLTRFELFVALRYLRAKRKQAVISVITIISIVGVAAGVAALIIALAINNGFRNTLQKNLLGATAHVNIVEKVPGYGIENWRERVQQARRLPHVVSAAPVLYGPVFVSGPQQSRGALLKGIDLGADVAASDNLRQLKQGSLKSLREPGKFPGIILGSKLAEETGMTLNAVVRIFSPQGELTPFGPQFSDRRFRVVGIFESGFYDIDLGWAYAAMPAVQQALSLNDVVNTIELRVDDIYKAPEAAAAVERTMGEKLAATTWMEQNQRLLSALRMEKVVTVITIGLIQLVAALNILIALVMMVMERYRDIAVLMSMGAKARQIRNVFIVEGLIIGVTGTGIGLVTGHVLSYLADRNRWIQLDQTVYALGFVPFEPRWPDSIWVAAAAIAVSFLATIYPARNAARIAPAEVLRYE